MSPLAHVCHTLSISSWRQFSVFFGTISLNLSSWKVPSVSTSNVSKYPFCGYTTLLSRRTKSNGERSQQAIWRHCFSRSCMAGICGALPGPMPSSLASGSFPWSVSGRRPRSKGDVPTHRHEHPGTRICTYQLRTVGGAWKVILLLNLRIPNAERRSRLSLFEFWVLGCP